MSGVHSRGLKFGPIAEANHAAESTLGCDPVIILVFVITMILIFVIAFVIIVMSIFVRTMVGAMERMELENVTCSSRTLITGLPSEHL